MYDIRAPCSYFCFTTTYHPCTRIHKRTRQTMVDIRKAWLLFWRDKLLSNDSNEMNSFKLLSVKIYNIKELLVLSLVSLKQKIYTTKGRSKKHFEKHQRSKHTSIMTNKYQSFPFHGDEVISLQGNTLDSNERSY